MIRIGIVGAGGMGSVHARQYRKRSDVELFFFDHNAGRAGKFQERFEAKPFSTVDTLIESVDVLDVCVPTPGHYEIGMKSLAAGKPTLMEKPMTLTLKEAVDLAETAAKANIPLMPAHVVRYFPEYRRTHEIVLAGGVGTPSAIRLRRGGTAPGGTDGWFMDHRKSGGILLDLCIHDFDWLRWTLGEVKHLFSRSVAIDKGAGPDYALTTLSFENGAVAHVEGTWMDPSGFRTALDFAGSKGLIQHDSRVNPAVRATVVPEPGEGAPLPNLEGAQFPKEDPYYLEIDAFLQSVQQGSPVPISALDGLMAVSISTAAIESAKTRRVVVPARHF